MVPRRGLFAERLQHGGQPVLRQRRGRVEPHGDLVVLARRRAVAELPEHVGQVHARLGVVRVACDGFAEHDPGLRRLIRVQQQQTQRVHRAQVARVARQHLAVRAQRVVRTPQRLDAARALEAQLDRIRFHGQARLDRVEGDHQRETRGEIARYRSFPVIFSSSSQPLGSFRSSCHLR